MHARPKILDQVAKKVSTVVVAGTKWSVLLGQQCWRQIIFSLNPLLSDTWLFWQDLTTLAILWFWPFDTAVSLLTYLNIVTDGDEVLFWIE